MSAIEYYKKIDKSIFKYGFTIPNDRIRDFLFDDPIELGKSRKIKVTFLGHVYEVNLNHVDIKDKKPVHQVRWDSVTDLINALKKEYIQTYFAIVSQNYNSSVEGKKLRTNLLGGNQEVLIFRSIDKANFEIHTFIKIETPYDNIFKRLVDENVFCWLSKITDDQLIYTSTKWMDISELGKHEEIAYVVYYLIDPDKKEIYIGSATTLGDRVKGGRHEIPGWKMFRYEIIHPQFHHLLRQVEYHSIMNFARFIENSGGLSNANISEYKLVNKDYKFYLK